MKLVIIVGRGHSGTRAFARTLIDSGVFMGKDLNGSDDFRGAGNGRGEMYRACRLYSRMVEQVGPHEWDFSKANAAEIPSEFRRRVYRYAEQILCADAEWVGWKLPETTLCLPWIVRMFPEAHYLWVVRDPRDVILKPHGTDDLSAWDVPCDGVPRGNARRCRVQSWLYQDALVRTMMPRPGSYMSHRPQRIVGARLHDLVHSQENTLTEMEGFLGIHLKRVPVYSSPVGRWRREGEDRTEHKPLRAALERHGFKW